MWPASGVRRGPYEAVGDLGAAGTGHVRLVEVLR